MTFAPGVALPLTVVLSLPVLFSAFGSLTVGLAGFFPTLPVALSEEVSPFLSIAVTLLPSLTLFAGIVTLPVFSSTFTPSGMLSPFHLPFSFLTVKLVGLVFSPSGVYVISRVSVPSAGVIVAEP